MTHTCGKIFSRNATGCKPMSEENVSAVAAFSCRRAHACSGRRPVIAFSSLIGLQPVAFWERSHRYCELEKSLWHNLVLLCNLAKIQLDCGFHALWIKLKKLWANWRSTMLSEYPIDKLRMCNTLIIIITAFAAEKSLRHLNGQQTWKT